MINVITGYGPDNRFSIPDEEAHKAYYLFNHPNERGTFSNGVSLVGSRIVGIEPDFNGTMGWNRTHQLDADDMNELRKSGVDRRLRAVLTAAAEVARLAESDQSLLSKPLELESVAKPAFSYEPRRIGAVDN